MVKCTATITGKGPTCPCPKCVAWRGSQGTKAVVTAVDTAISRGAIGAGAKGAGTISTVVGREAGNLAGGGLSGAARGAGAASSLGVGVVSMVGGMAGNAIGGGIAKAVGGDRFTQNCSAEGGEFAGSVGGGAAVGVVVGGPVGAAAGAAVGVAGYGITKASQGIVSCFVTDGRYDWGWGMGLCAACGSVCNNRGCKRCNQTLCLDCWQEKHRGLRQAQHALTTRF